LVFSFWCLGCVWLVSSRGLYFCLMLGQRTTGEVKVGFGMGLDTAPRRRGIPETVGDGGVLIAGCPKIIMSGFMCFTIYLPSLSG
jgi:hypothetical protein